VIIQNNGSAAVFLGGPNVTVSGANTGISVAAGASVLVPSVGTNAETLFGVVAEFLLLILAGCVGTARQQVSGVRDVVVVGRRIGVCRLKGGGIESRLL
jgi:hypothetical protein